MMQAMTFETSSIDSTPLTSAAPQIETLTYSVDEVARVLGVSLPTVYRLISRRVLKPLPGLRHKRISKRQITWFINSSESAR